jgi:hypothetical protein
VVWEELGRKLSLQTKNRTISCRAKFLYISETGGDLGFCFNGIEPFHVECCEARSR